MTAREDTIERIERVLGLTHKNSLTVTIPRLTAERAVALLKEQEAVVRCKDCKFYPDGKGTTKWLPCREIIVPPMWFCADGKKSDS